MRTEARLGSSHCSPRELSPFAAGPFLFAFRERFQTPHVQSKEKQLPLDVPGYLSWNYQFQLLP